MSLRRLCEKDKCAVGRSGDTTNFCLLLKIISLTLRNAHLSASLPYWVEEKKNTWREFIVYNQGEMSADEVFFLLCLDMSTKWGGGGEKKLTFYCHMNVKIVLKLSIIMAFHAAIFKKMRPNLVKFATTPHSKKKLSCHLVSCRKKKRSQ